MFDFLRHFQLDRLSFWLGFIAGTIFWWILGRLRPLFALGFQKLKAQAQSAREELLASTAIRLENETTLFIQGQHLAAPLFSLDETLVPPRVLTPPPVESETILKTMDITEQVLPYLPDWTELAVIYRMPAFSLAEALQGGANLVLVGRPGAGKTTALAHLALQFTRHDPQIGNLDQQTPFLVQAADLVLPPSDPQGILQPLVDALNTHASALLQPRLAAFVKTTFESGRAILLLDGLDEFPPPVFQQIAEYLNTLILQFPGTRAVVAAAPEYFDGLTRLGFIPVALAAWGKEERQNFISKWSDLWTRFVSPLDHDQAREADPLLILNWLLDDPAPLTPMELTLKVWGAFAGDLPGPGAKDALDAYLRRMTVNQPDARKILEQIATQSITSQQPVILRKDIEASLSHDLPGLLESGLMAEHAGGRLSLVHMVFTAYLAGNAFVLQPEGDNLASQPDWPGKALARQFLAGQAAGADWLVNLLDEAEEDPLIRGLFQTAYWLRYAPETAGWRSAVMRRLAACLQDKSLALGLRARALTALVTLNASGADILFRQSLKSSDPNLRQLAALGCGAVRDTKAVGDLSLALADPSPLVKRAVCLGLAAIGDKDALEAVASALLHGDEDLRRAAAEALANHPEEGYPILKEGSTLDDFLVRRAVVFGLARVRLDWAREMLEKMRLDDSQWVVKSAAAQVLEDLAQPDPSIPKPFPALLESPWLVSFAADRGAGVAPGKPAQDLVLLAAAEGNEDQRLAALQYLGFNGGDEAIEPLYKALSSSVGDVREVALNALWHLAGSGLNLPPNHATL